MSSSDAPRPWLHFAGAAGSGMSALVQFHAGSGGFATGSDRAFDHGERADERAAFERLGVVITPQDGSFLAAAPGPCSGLVVSTAVEDDVPDVAAARAAGVPILHRSELLARYVEQHRTVAVSGTSGKSTVTAMVFSILRAAGLGPGLLTGAALADLAADGHLGNAWAPAPRPGDEPLLVIEADESDGSLVRYRPWCGVVLNLGLDHKPPAEIMAMFRTFRARTRGPFVVGDDPALDELADGALRFGLAEGRPGLPGCFAADVVLGPASVRFTLDGTPFTVPHPGRHTVLNACAAAAACRTVGVDDAVAARALAGFGGVARRFCSLGTARGVEVIDDFAHNPDKIAAALAAARGRAPKGRVLAVFQPHGFGPTRFLKDALIAAFAEALAPGDVAWLPEIFYAGGTVSRDISSADLAAGVTARGRDARFVAVRADIPAAIAAEAKAGDLVLVMGARDPSLTAFGRTILAALGQER
ncbi:MAG TPA: cyanophycin synthetase [Candidatus Krumholzibacteria bacterium]|nr:cyanophycin synthetase [Candidatus Krumholzibacteria bacterium]